MENEMEGALTTGRNLAAERQQANGFMQQFEGTRTSFDQLSPLPAGTTEEKASLWRLANNEGELLTGVINNVIGVSAWMVLPIQVERGEQGEVRTIPMLKLLCDDGTIYRTTGEKLIRSLLGYHFGVRPAPWNPPLRFKIVRKPGRGTNSYYDIEAFEDSAIGAQGSKARKPAK